MKAKLLGYTKAHTDNLPSEIIELVAYCARVSNPASQSSGLNSDKLISYLIKNKHWSPFEMINVLIELETTRDIGRQLLRHRSFSFQEFCVDEDTEIYFDLPKGVELGEKRLYKKKIKDIYKAWTKNDHSKSRIQDMYVRVFDESQNKIANAHIKEVFYTGKKPVFKITLANNKTITCTKDHKFLCESKFDSLENIIGLTLNGKTASMSKKASIACNGELAYQNKDWLSEAKERSIQNKTGVQGIPDEAGVSYHTIRKWLKILDLSFTKKEVARYIYPWNKGKFGYKRPPHSEETREKIRKSASDSNLWRGGVDRAERLKITDYIANMFLTKANFKCVKCGSSNKLELHHIIPVHEDITKAYDLDNIEVLCYECHRDTHKTLGSFSINKPGLRKIPAYSDVVSVEYIGEKDTYDLEIDHPSHNYVANGIITHNSQRYANINEMGFELREARLQDTKNRQNSIDIEDQTLHDQWSAKQQEIIDLAKKHYDWAIQAGIAKEQARVILPEGNTLSKIIINGSLRSYIHYLQLRTKNGTQKEHIALANAIAEAISEIFPIKDYINEPN